MTHHTLARIARLSTLCIAITVLCSACGQFGGNDGHQFEGYWVGDATSEITSDGEVERENINYAVVEVVATEGALIVIFENFLNTGIPCIVEAEVDSEDKFDIERTSCYSDDTYELEISGKGELSGGDSLSIELDVKDKQKYGVEFVDEGKAEFDLELF